jgi:hypothetical protein
MLALQVAQAAVIPAPGELRGAAVAGNVMYTWGEQLTAWTLPSLERKVLAAGNFGEGGCLTDLDDDGETEFVGGEGSGLGNLTYRRSPGWRPETIDTEIEMHDCRQATLFGRRGVLMVNRGMQVRFYERPSTAAPHWPYREIYSFYTASYQGDLVLYDVDSDGLEDILCGNYWIKSPRSFALPWQLFAINTHHEKPESALVRFVPMPDGSIWIFQTHIEAARAWLFSKPADPRQLWKEDSYGEGMNLSRLHAVRRAGRDVFVGEHNGEGSRLLRFRKGVNAEPTVVGTGFDVLQLFPLDESRWLLVGPNSITVWSYRPRK